MGRYNVLLEDPKKSLGATPPSEPVKHEKEQAPQDKPQPQASPAPVHHENTSEHMVAHNRDTVVSRHQDTIEIIRKAVKELGKEAATYRFTQEEKRMLSDIVYSYKGRGIRTSENEITRIAINALVEDYRQNGENSTLARVLERLND